MKTVYSLASELKRELKSHFMTFENDQSTVSAYMNNWLVANTRTSGNNYKYPKKDIHALKMLLVTLMEDYMEQFTIYCYNIDGDLYTTYNSDKPFKYNFRSHKKPVMENYRDAGKEVRLMELQKNSGNVQSGFYYPTGKPYFVMKG